MSRSEAASEVLGVLERMGSKSGRDGLARYGIQAPKSFGVPMAKIQGLAKELGRDHDLAVALWESGWYDARLLAAYVDEPDKVTAAQMDRWCGDFDNWGIADTVCFVLFDRTPHAFAKVAKWSRQRGEFQRRAGFALLASLAGHDKASPDQAFERCLELIENAASDERNFVKKGVSWALRMVGRRSLQLHQAAVALARRLAASTDPTERWLGKEALRDLLKPAVLAKLKKVKKGVRS